MDPGLSGGKLDLDVRGKSREMPPLFEHSLGVRVVRRVRLDRKPALATTLANKHGLEHGRTTYGHLVDDGPGQIGLGP